MHDERNLLELAVSVPRFQHFRESQTIFDGFAAENPSAFTLTGLGEAVQILGGQVTSNYFDVLGVRPIRGRTFLPNEEETRRRRDGDGKLLAQAAGRRSGCCRAQHHARWLAAHDCWRAAEHAVLVGGPGGGSVDDEAVSDCGPVL